MTGWLYMLDTNTAIDIIKGSPPNVKENLLKTPMESICISAITEAELLRGVAKIQSKKQANAKQLSQLVKEFLLRVEI